MVLLVMSSIFNSVCTRLNEWQNHRTQTEFENSMIMNQFAFDFVNNYFYLFYRAIRSPAFFVPTLSMKLQNP